MKLIQCNESQHAAAILAIFNEAIANSTALYDYSPRKIDSMAPWFATKRQQNFPVIGLETENGQLAGFASYGTFRAWPAYHYTVEHSIYLHCDYRGQGQGKILLNALIDAAIGREVHVLIGAIDTDNQASIHLHQRAGFTHAGDLKQVAFKFDRWLDLAFYQLTLPTPHQPIGGH